MKTVQLVVTRNSPGIYVIVALDDIGNIVRTLSAFDEAETTLFDQTETTLLGPLPPESYIVSECVRSSFLPDDCRVLARGLSRALALERLALALAESGY